jgi:Tfp pilus assembly protein PilZ
MNNSNKGMRKYNLIISKLIEVVFQLGRDKQLKLLQYAEQLLIEDQRVSSRKTCHIPVNYASHDRIYSSFIHDISASGIYITTEKPLLVGEDIVVSFSIEGYDRPFKIKGKIVRTDQKGVGIEYKDVSHYVEEMLELLVKRM